MKLKFCIEFQSYIPTWTHDVFSYSSVAKQQQSELCMVLYIAHSDTGQFIACMCQISLVWVNLRKRYESTLSYFWLTLVCAKSGIFRMILHIHMPAHKQACTHTNTELLFFASKWQPGWGITKWKQYLLLTESIYIINYQIHLSCRSSSIS